MIFVTVGTHEQPFDRLVRAMDELVTDGILIEPVFIQTGYCVYEPKHCEWAQFIPAPEMRGYMVAADVVVTHGGPSSFIEAMAAGKVPVVVPRRAEYGEHVNNHQVDFVREVEERKGGIVPVYDTSSLPDAIEIAHKASFADAPFANHNAEFCQALSQLVERL